MPRCEGCNTKEARYKILYPYFGAIKNHNHSPALKVINHNNKIPITIPIIGKKLCIYCYHAKQNNQSFVNDAEYI
jgi:hypothetical protein